LGIITLPGFFLGIITVPGLFLGIVTIPLICLGIITVLILDLITVLILDLRTVLDFRDYSGDPSLQAKSASADGLTYSDSIDKKVLIFFI
jgi:hypothetical protein